ncbi:hypothetical protein DTO271D3_7923 [Paecilomyces variotii]|nr:hypothetical protein DTO169E5_9100 [Paecilomyces variotii]KAJ9273098.1 hypothetical protein DTO212C5_683 [Paecilomyces variotii]KAJ9311788.1 hypothetical protein DTO271D3_7923 [Paecilomyces variotii]
MAPSSGHLLLPKVWRAARFAYEKAYRALKSKFPEQIQQAQLRLQPAYARITPKQPISRAAAIRQARGRYFSTHAAGKLVNAAAARGSAPSYQSTRVGSAVSRLTAQAPFATTLRPNLTGGTLGRTAGGYAIGAGRVGGARYFSHGPANPAQVINNVSQGVRAFFLSGQRVRFDGIDPRTGEKRYKAVTALQDQTERRMADIPRASPGSYIDFEVSPTITAFGVMGGLQKKQVSAEDFEQNTLSSEGLLELLSVDFARALKDFAAVLNDLKRLSALGDLPISLQGKSTIRVGFPGCDADTVERLCDEVGVERGRIIQDEDFEVRNAADLALLFPFAPSVAPSSAAGYFNLRDPPGQQTPHEVDWRDMMSSERKTHPSWIYSPHTGTGLDYEDVEMFGPNPWTTSPSGYSSVDISELGDRGFFPELSVTGGSRSADHEGLGGIYRFISECDQAAAGR